MAVYQNRINLSSGLPGNKPGGVSCGRRRARGGAERVKRPQNPRFLKRAAVSGRMKRMNKTLKGIAVAAVAALALFPGRLDAMNHVYKGHYTSGSAAWTVEKGHIYKGHYASGSADWSFDGKHIWKGHYTSGSAAWTYSNGHLYRGHYDSGAAAYTYEKGHIWEGHYTSGAAVYSYDKDHLWRGHYTSGSAIASWDSRDEIPDGVLAFIATQLVD